MTTQCVAVDKALTVGQMIEMLRKSGFDCHMVSYIYICAEPNRVLQGVVDLRDAVLARDETPLEELMVSPVVAAESDDVREDLEELFAKYHYRMLPVVDRGDHLLGVIHHKDIMKGTVARATSY